MNSSNPDIDLGDWVKRLATPAPIEMELARQIRADADEYVPFLSGQLASDIMIEAGTHPSIVYAKEYAQKQWNGVSPHGKKFNYTKTHHKKAGPEWVNMAKEERLLDWVDLSKDLIINGR